MKNRKEPFEAPKQSPSKLTRRDALTATLGVIGLTAWGVVGGFFSKIAFPQPLVFEFPDKVAAQGLSLIHI